MRRVKILLVLLVLLILGGYLAIAAKGCLWLEKEKKESTSGSSGPWRQITSPWGRWKSAKVVWTGNEMIIWGGADDSEDLVITGIKYAPISNTWSTISTIGAPVTRVTHTALWTGNPAEGGTGEMLVWGGYNGIVRDDGGRYNPAIDTWAPITTTNAPQERMDHTAIWTGSEMLIWGGTGYSGELNDGGRYNPTTDTWTPITTTNAPIPRNGHSAIWTGAEMLVWGGYGDNIFFNDGAKYNPTTDTWIPITTTGAPSERRFHTAFWTGSEMLIWGGSGDNWALMENGAKYNPISDTWTSITTTNAPLLRYRYSAVWTGTEMFIWGGGNAEWGTDVTMYFNDGSKYNPSTDTWIPLPPVNLIPRWGHFSVWTGQEIIIWGGDTNGDTTFYDGAIYKP